MRATRCGEKISFTCFGFKTDTGQAAKRVALQRDASNAPRGPHA